MGNLNVIEKANKVLSFRKRIREICQKDGLEYPADDKMAEWIEKNNELSVKAFMNDYVKKQGVFSCPFDEFKEAVRKITRSMPTDEEMREYISKNGYNVEGFLQQRTINSYNPLEKKVLFAVLTKCTIPQLVALWNDFVEESAMYGEDSYIYDLKNEKDLCNLSRNMSQEEWDKVKSFNSRWIVWHNLNDGKIFSDTDDGIKGTIICYWSDIFPRLIVWHSCYENIGREGTEQYFEYFFDSVILPVFCEKLGYDYDPSTGTIVEIKS